MEEVRNMDYELVYDVLVLPSFVLTSSGTENVLQIVALGTAAKIALREQMEMFKHLLLLRVRFLTVLRRKFASTVIYIFLLP